MALRAGGAFCGLLALAATRVSADFMDEGFTDTPSPNTAIEKPECNASIPVRLRYSSTSARMYLESADGETRGGCVTIDQIWEARAGKEPLYAVDPDTGDISDTVTGTWLLTESLYVEDGITLKVWGNASGGYGDELRLLSTENTFINLRAHGGNLDFENTKVFSWDTGANTYDTNETDGRSYISCVSEIITDANETCEGRAKNTMGEARMDIVSSEMGYLGYHDSESYGLTWKVRGFCTDKSNHEVFDKVNVYGNIYDSEIHHNNFAVYTYGHQQGDWRRNTLHSNSGYGFDPHDDSDHLTIHDNIVYDNAWHGIIASKRCNNVSIQGNTVYGGGEISAGIFLHRSSDFATVKNNHCYNNGDAGMAMLESFSAEVSDNVFENNKYGIRLSVGCADNVFTNNLIQNTTKYALYTYEGTDAPDVVNSGYSQDNIFQGNTIIDSAEAMKFKESDGNQIINNLFVDATSIQFANSSQSYVYNNTGLEDAELSVDNACFAEGSDAQFEPIC